MLKLIRAFKYAAHYLKARDYCSEGDYLNAYERLKRIDKSRIKDKSLVKCLLLEAHTLFQMKDFEASETLFHNAIKEIKQAKRLSLGDKQHLFEYINQHFDRNTRMEGYNTSALRVDSSLKNTFPLIDS